MRKVVQKLNSSLGMSLAETLMAVLILLLVSSVIAAGIPAAANAYTKAVDAANAQTLLSTTVNALRSEISTAWSVEPSTDNKSVTYYKASTGTKTRMLLGVDDNSNNHLNTILVQDYVRFDDDTQPQKPEETKTLHALISYSGITKNLNVVYNTISFIDNNPTVLCFHGVQVQKADGTAIGEGVDISIHLLNADFTIPELPT